MHSSDLSNKIKCPHCGYEMPLTYEKDANCKGVFVRCKGRKCKKIFEIQIGKGKDSSAPSE